MSTHEHDGGRDASADEGAARDEVSGASEQSGDARSASLDVSPDELRELARVFSELTLDYFASPDALPVFPETSADAVAEIFRRPLPVEGADARSLERDCAEMIKHSRQSRHPRMYGYVASPAAPAAALASLFAAALNQNVTSWRSAPAATEIERTVVRWLAEMIGYAGEGSSADCGGLLTSGGSMANLNALFVAHRTKAREAAHDNTQDTSHDGAQDDSRGGAQDTSGGGAHDPSREGLWNAGAPMTVYASDQIHLSVTKAADILGLGRGHVRLVPSDEKFRLDVRALREMMEADARAGLRPFCVVASAGTVSTGAVDPPADVARGARARSLWLHADGAYGALAAAVKSKRELFAGLTEADSVSLDPHKWLYAPIDCGRLILREPLSARAAFAGTDEGYIQIFERQEDEAFAFWDYGVELSRPFRALKVWTILRYYGARRLSASIEEDCALADYMAGQVSASA